MFLLIRVGYFERETVVSHSLVEKCRHKESWKFNICRLNGGL